MEQIGTNWNILSQTHKYLMQIRLEIVFVAKVLAYVKCKRRFYCNWSCWCSVLFRSVSIWLSSLKRVRRKSHESFAEASPTDGLLLKAIGPPPPPLKVEHGLRESFAKMTISTNKNLDPPSISLPAFSELFMYHARIKLPKIHGSNMSLNYGLQWWASRYGMKFKCD